MVKPVFALLLGVVLGVLGTILCPANPHVSFRNNKCPCSCGCFETGKCNCNKELCGKKDSCCNK